jgi:nucleotide-binding universal stress UspA family protein
MYKKILVPLDRSQRAETILPHVEFLASKCGATVVFLEVVTPPVTASPTRRSIELQQQEMEARESRARAYLAELQRRFREKGIESSGCLAHGSVVEEIISAAQRERVDVIAIASHGRSGLARAFYGSVTAALLQRVDKPLLLVRSI